MAHWRRIVAQLRSLLANKRAEEDLAREVASHLTLLADDFERRGMSPEEARLAARRAYGGVEQAKQAHRDERSLLWIEQTMQDLRYGLRTLSKSPGFTITAVLTLALGIGACTAIFSLVNAVLIRSLPYGDPSRLVYLYTPIPQFKLPVEMFGPAYADFYDLKRDSHSFQDMTAFGQSVFSLASQGAAERVSAARVDGDFFRTFQSAPELGREITPGDNQLGHEKVAVISHALWQSMFGSAADVLHRSLLLDGKNYQIVGVMPQGFEYPHITDLAYGESQYKTTQVWIPLALTPHELADRDNARGNAVARLRPGVSIAQAQAEMAAIMTRLDKLHDPQMRGWSASVKNFVDSTVGHVRSLLWLLLCAVSIVLLIACGNAANLLLARAASRMRELGVRVALGAGRSRITRQLLTEALLIGVAAGAIGIGLAFAFLRLLPLLDPGNIPRLREASLDTRVLLFTVAVSLLTSVLTGILPALGCVANQSDGLSRHDRQPQRGRRAYTPAKRVSLSSNPRWSSSCWPRRASSCAATSTSNRSNTGFSQSTVTLNIELEPRYNHPQAVEFFRNLFARLQALPGVETVGAVNNLPLSNSEDLRMFAVDGYPNQKTQLAEAFWVTPNYFRAMRIPLIAGRLFTADEKPGAQTIIINQSFARKYFAGRKPIGGRVSRQDDYTRWATVVGVIGDVRHTSLEEPARAANLSF